MLNDEVARSIPSGSAPTWISRVLRIEWLGQTGASVCWIASVFAYGISSSGDYLQLTAASAWLIANITAAVSTQVSSTPNAARVK